MRQAHSSPHVCIHRGARARLPDRKLNSPPDVLMTPTLDEMRREFLDKGLLIGNAERDPEIVRRQRVDLVDLGAQRFAAQIAVGMPDDLQVGIHLADVGDGGGVLAPRPAPNM